MKITRLQSLKEVGSLVSTLNAKGTPAALDIETTGLNPRTDKILTVVITGPEVDSAYVFPLDVAAPLAELQVDLIFHNAKFDLHFLYLNGINLRNHHIRDTVLLHHLWDENQPHGLDHIVKTFWNTDYKEKFWDTYKTFTDAPQDAQDQYAGRDVIYTLKLYHKLVAYLRDRETPKDFIDYVHNFASHLLATEIRGLRVDTDKVLALGVESRIKSLELLKQLNECVSEHTDKITGRMWKLEKDKRKTDKGKANVKRPRFNFGSSAQLQTLLYSELKLPVQYGPTRSPTVDDGALAKLEQLHPVIPLLREYRAEEKLFTAFLEATIDKSEGGRIYPSFNVNGTVTGRISASNPNLQQLPATGGIRSMYVPDPGYVFISADYSQLEVTLAAHYSLDPNLLRVINEGVSLHDITAQGLGIDRSKAKTINFALQYGAGVKKIQKILNCSETEAQLALDKYWQTYPGLKRLIDRCHACVDTKTAILNPFGRERHLIVDNPRDKWAVAAVKRQAFNSLIQGTGADMTNYSFTVIASELLESGEGHALLVVHDEILISVKKEYAVYWEGRLKQVMEATAKKIGLRVPLKAETSGAMEAWND